MPYLQTGLHYAKAFLEGDKDTLSTLFHEKIVLHYFSSTRSEDRTIQGRAVVLELYKDHCCGLAQTLSINDLRFVQTVDGFTVQILSNELKEKCKVQIEPTSGKISKIAWIIARTDSLCATESNSKVYVTALSYYLSMLSMDQQGCGKLLTPQTDYIYTFNDRKEAIPILVSGGRNVKHYFNESYFNITADVTVSQLQLSLKEFGIASEYERTFTINPDNVKVTEICFDTLQFDAMGHIATIGARISRYKEKPLGGAQS